MTRQALYESRGAHGGHEGANYRCHPGNVLTVSVHSCQMTKWIRLIESILDHELN